MLRQKYYYRKDIETSKNLNNRNKEKLSFLQKMLTCDVSKLLKLLSLPAKFQKYGGGNFTLIPLSAILK